MSEQKGNMDRAAEIFERASQLQGEARERYLEGACGGDASLRADIDSMMEAHAEQGEFLASPTQGNGEPDEQATETREYDRSGEGPGKTIGRYKLLQHIGEGGFGTVYMAEQQEPVHRKVALKIIKLGMDTKQVVARFEAERQALAMMNHPHVARVFDGGATSEGRPYFVMELVKGIPITEYCDKHRLSIPKRLELFQQLCEAVQHAHQKGIIHRDLKPSNVMVTVQDVKPTVKVIDFGVAKATERHLTERTLFTEQGQLIGTPAYMSPEQAEMTGLDIDTRTDIYSLGVLLYELLVGALPFESGKLRQAGLVEIHRIIREEEPHKPSTRFNSLGDESTTIAQHRRVDVKQLASLLRGDLDWITMMAMDKDRTRRYATATEFAADLSRHLRHEPVVASPPSTAYRFRKFLRRNKWSVAVVGVVIVTLAIGLFAAWVMYLEAERNGAMARAVLGILTPEATGEWSSEVAVHEAVDVAFERLGSKPTERPLVEADIRAKLAVAYWRVGQYAEAERHAKKALRLRRARLGREHRDTLASMDTLAIQYKYQGRYDEAEALYKETLDTRRRVLGEEDPDTLQSMNNLAVLLRKQGRLDQAERLHRQARTLRTRTLGPEHPDTLSSAANLAVLLWEKGELDEAEPLARDVLETRRGVLGAEHPDTLQSMHNLARILVTRGRLDEARPLYEETLRVGRRVFGEEHPWVATTLRNLAKLFRASGDDLAAEPLLAEALEIRRGKLGDDDDATLAVVVDLASCQAGLDKSEEAETILRDAYASLQTRQRELNLQTRKVIETLAEVYDAWGRPDEANAWRARLSPRNASGGHPSQDR